MADMFLEPIIEMLISAGLRYLKDQVTWHKRTNEELQKLKAKLPQIQAVVHFASSQDHITDQNPALNAWLWQLRDAIDDAKDVLDELEYMELEKQVTKDKKPRRDEEQATKDKKLRRVRSIMNSMKKRFVKIGKRALKIDPTLKRLEEAVEQLYGVSTNVDSFFDIVKDAKQEHIGQQLELYRARESGSLPKSALNVRDKETKLVLEWLRNPSNEPQRTDLFYRNISLLSIVGHGGMGKTTLLQHVYTDVNKDEEITKEFDHKMWVCVSNNFDVKKVIGDMLECLKKEKPRVEALHSLQDSLRTEVKSKKFLLVLDDVWDEAEGRDQSKWEDVLPSLASGAFGSKILVTTRTDSVALMFARVISKKEKIVKLEGLEEDACLQILNFHALAGVADDDHKMLKAISGEIVKKLLGSPLAAKVIGVFLNEKLDEGHWRSVLESNFLNQNSINSILTLSYMVLPNLLRSCFAFCCMFPQDHEYDKVDLVRMWIALGFIKPSQGMTMEDIGGSYFDVLVKKSLIDKVENDYKMHDLIHESASIFFAQECGKLVDDEVSSLKISETVRHLYVETTNPNIIEKIGQFKYLHSLFLSYEAASDQDLCNGLIEIFKASRSLRLLYVFTHIFDMIPKEIGNLIHLRCLNIYHSYSTRLPRSVTNLYHLQYLIYDGDVDLLPSDIIKLTNLRYVKLSKNYISSICGIGKLKSLQKLKMFDLRNESGYRIEELQNMNDLCKLGINCLENVKDAKEACKAKLCVKTRLTDLKLYWSNTDSRNMNLDENVLDNLQPPRCLRNLSIKRYMGARHAIWMNNVNPIFNLERIVLKDCLECETLPPFGQLPFLKCLTLRNMPKVKWLQSKFNGNDKCHIFPLLVVLHIWELEALEDWFEGGVSAEDGCLFPNLIHLILDDCPALKELPSLPSKLKGLRLENTGWRSLNFCSNSNPIPLETLKVFYCPNITSLPLADEITRLAALRDLTIEKCPNLISLGVYREVETTNNNCHLMLNYLSISDPSVLQMEPLKSIASLKKLIIWLNDELVSFPNEAEQWFLSVRSSLCELKFMCLESLQSLPSCLESLSSLHDLYIYNVPMLRELPNLPPSLERLAINGCPLELKDRYREGVGSYQLIQNIAEYASILFLAGGLKTRIQLAQGWPR